MDQDKIIQELLSTIQSSINSFNKGLSGVQSKMFDEILSLVKDLELSNNNIKNSTANLKLIMQINSRLQRVVMSREYQNNLKTFVKSFSNIDRLQRDYFVSYLEDDKLIPTEKLSIIKEYSIGSTIDALTEKGLGVNVISKIENVIRQSTTTGGDFPNLQKQLRNLIVADKDQGVLEKYASTVANDTINQYNRQVMETTSMDLNMPWRRYVGSLKTTSREWCERMVAKKYIHVSELPLLVKGNIDGHQCAIYKKTPENKGTDLPYGLEAGTNAQNVLVRAGGHGCDHSFYPCLESEVPKEILEKFKEKEPVKKEESKHEEIKSITIDKEQKTIKDVSNILEELSKITKYFSRGFKSVQLERKQNNNGSTDMNGKISLSKSKLDAVISALNKIREGKEKTEIEEKGLATLWHEIWHNRNQKGYIRLDILETNYMELGNEFVARNTLDEFMKQLGTKLVHIDLKNNRIDTGYNNWVVRYSKIIKALDINNNDVVKNMIKSMETASYNEIKSELVNALKNNYKGEKKIDFVKAVEVCLNESDFDTWIKTHSLK